MTTGTRRSTRRAEALSRERIVAAAVELLDAAGEAGLTFRALTERLATGPGAIYWHVANKGELLVAATETVVADALATEPAGSSPHARLRAVALGLFDAIEAHPWVAGALSTLSYQSTAPWILESVGREVRALGVPAHRWLGTASVLVDYILGAAGQHAALAAGAAEAHARGELVDRPSFLGAAADRWARLDPDAFPFTRAVADQLRHHDDREQFLAGVDLVVAGATGAAAGA